MGWLPCSGELLLVLGRKDAQEEGRPGRAEESTPCLGAPQPPSQHMGLGFMGGVPLPLAWSTQPLLTCLQGAAAGTHGQRRHGSPALPLHCSVQALLLWKQASGWWEPIPFILGLACKGKR